VASPCSANPRASPTAVRATSKVACSAACTGYRCITRTELDSRVTVLADRFEGKRLNAPNDIVCRSDGTTGLTHEIVSVGQSSPPSVPWLMEKFVCCTLTIHQFSRHSQSFGSGKARSISLTAVRRPRVNQDSLLLASFLG